jgi:hypothetical protein
VTRITPAEVREMVGLARDIHGAIHPVRSAAVGVALDWLEKLRDELSDLAAQMEIDATKRDSLRNDLDIYAKAYNDMCDKRERAEAGRDALLAKAKGRVSVPVTFVGDPHNGYDCTIAKLMKPYWIGNGLTLEEANAGLQRIIDEVEATANLRANAIDKEGAT